ncbi:uncharacterized protein EKO05_0003876 [Ascochyta rabiei]|nr:uncharacterized protein EKO05_0003876 [Ascochyta rabiei]UPX13366.1 hypothetical protein EKO05_0003876 [Ascochyta rabiei]
MRVTAEHVTDMRGSRDLVRDADVVVQGYRPGMLNKYGFSPGGLLELTKNRERGLIFVRENCYGWHGPWSYRNGWQQISDANCGMSMVFGRAMGDDEPITPVFPNSDYCTGIPGIVAVLNALRRGSEGGSYKVDVALKYYSQWLVNSVGVYPHDVWDDVWTCNGRQMLKANAGDVVLKPEFFEKRHSGAIGKDVLCIKPIIQYPNGKVELKYNVGTRGTEWLRRSGQRI